jgi:uncharacterized protein YjiS (DUF1127 family)
MCFGTPVFPAPARLKAELVTPTALVEWVFNRLRIARAILERRRERRALLDLSDRMLEDFGIAREEAVRIPQVPFWK